VNVTVATARRPDGGRRDELWEFCSRWWTERFPQWPIHAGDTPGVFNRGAALNAAARAAGRDWDVLLIADGDVVAEPEQVQAAVERAHETGRLTFAFTEYRALSPQMTDKVLDGFSGNWNPGVRLRMSNHLSSLIAVPRALWERICGFDERLEGWGHDDGIFAHTARVLGGGCERISGAVWHLNHPKSPHTAADDPGHRAAGRIAQRYYQAVTPAAVEQLIAERAQPESCVLVVITDGRRDCIGRSLPAALENLKGLPIARMIICDDSADIEYQAWLRLTFPDAELVTAGKRGGFAKAVRRGWDVALGSGQPWVFWLEDDFVINEPVDLAAIATVMTERPYLTQVVLRRQPWFPKELEAGGIIEMDPGAYTDHVDGAAQWVEHQLGHWTNPGLLRRSFLAAHTWPDCKGSEARFGREVMKGEARSAFWGARTDPPAVTHIGERHGTGY
jgi:hypothetical protein